MLKTTYQKELLVTASQKRNDAASNKKNILKIHSWLNLYELIHPGKGTLTGIDGNFGAATDQAVKN